MNKKSLLVVLVTVLALSLSGCLSFLSPQKPGLQVTPDKVELYLDQAELSVTLNAVAQDSDGNEIEVDEEDIKWAVDDEEIAELNKNTGTEVVVTGKSAGRTEINVTYKDITVTVKVTVLEEKPLIPLFEDFSDLEDLADFWTVEYKSYKKDGEALPMYFVTGGGSAMELDENKQVKLHGSRFTIGCSDRAQGTTEGGEAEPGGGLDLSRPWKITIDVSLPESPAGNFQVYVDNNTAGMNNSKWGGDSKLYASPIADMSNGPLVIESELGGETSFIQIRTDSSGVIFLNSFKLEYQ